MMTVIGQMTGLLNARPVNVIAAPGADRLCRLANMSNRQSTSAARREAISVADAASTSPHTAGSSPNLWNGGAVKIAGSGTGAAGGKVAM
jgi:hypothetical protein